MKAVESSLGFCFLTMSARTRSSTQEPGGCEGPGQLAADRQDPESADKDSVVIESSPRIRRAERS